MTRKLSLTTAFAVAALSVGVPTALGVDRQPDSSRLTPAYFDERATMAFDSQAPFVSPDTQERIEAAGQPTQTNVLTRSDSAESAVVAGRLTQSNLVARSDSGEAAAFAGQTTQPNLLTRSDSAESAVVAGQTTQANLLTRSDSAEAAVVAGHLDAPIVSTGNSGNETGSSGTEIEWQQVGIGLGIGILLGLGLWLAVRFGRIRPLAH